ncbi:MULTISPECIES: protein kinase domain-containing protein [Deinococcus]|uniref:Serine/threonine protein kinase n=1 Tax=Deinococcus metallilatus TaxID=1211322 RepID=A0ABR6MQA2_9DEIO|nr:MULTISPECIES: protein kinase [Deinococcus]MBB5293889.1 serine/threonine protein kinase [Deinococcus metallilatus]
MLGSTAPSTPYSQGHHSVGYFVRHADGREGFLKAIDLSNVYQAPNVMQELQAVSAQFNFEVSLLAMCRNLRMHRVVRAISHGEERLPGVNVPVPYIIFDRADGDVRDHLAITAIDEVWLLRCIHHVAVGVQQLHIAKLAHNDLKPANVLVFSEDGWKIGDLGTAVDALGKSPHHETAFPGTWEYAPPEALYFAQSADVWRDRKRADLYMLGGLVTFLFTHQHFNSYLYAELDEAMRPLFCGGDWEEDFPQVLPHLLDAFGRAMRGVSAQLQRRLGPVLAAEVTRSIGELCFPDPLRRGHPRNLGRVDPTGLQQYVSLFDRLAVAAALRRKQRAP